MINSDMFNSYESIKSKMLKNKCVYVLRNSQFLKIGDKDFKIYDATSVLIDAISNAVSVAKVLNSKEMIYNGILLSDKTN